MNKISKNSWWVSGSIKKCRKEIPIRMLIKQAESAQEAIEKAWDILRWCCEDFVWGNEESFQFDRACEE